MATLADFEALIEPIDVATLAALLASATVEAQWRVIAQKIADRDAATAAADADIADAQAQLTALQTSQVATVTPVKSLG